MKKKIYVLLIIMLVASLFTSTYYIIINYIENKEQNEIFEELEDIAIEDKEESGEKVKEGTKDLKRIHELNNDFVGWLKIDDTNINYPVMQTDNDRKDYYLRKNFYKEYSQFGTPYVAEYCNILTSDNVIIYSHNIRNNKMFGELENYKNKKFYYNHRIIHFNTIYESGKYEIVAVFKTVAYYGFDYYKFFNARSIQEFDTYIKRCKELSFYEIEETAKYGDRLITLSTCEYSKKNSRLVIVAKKIMPKLEE